MRAVPGSRIRVRNERDLSPRGDFILYWMISQRRLRSNFALQRAVEWARALDKPLVLFEALRVGYPHASDRLHRFVLDGMADHRRALAASRALYYPYVEPTPGADKGLLHALAERACVVVTDDFPTFFLPRMVEKVAPTLPVRLDQVDSTCLVPLADAPRVFGTAHSFRTWLAKNLDTLLHQWPEQDPLAALPARSRPRLPAKLLARWPMAGEALLAGDPESLARLPIDHAVPVSPIPGGPRAAHARLKRFIGEKLADYDQARSDPAVDGSSRLSPYLHFGHLSVHEIVEALMRAEGTTRTKLRLPEKPRRRALFGLSPAAETFLDELITWRELGYIHCAKRDDHARYESLPEWSRRTLEKHAKDPRPHLYARAELEEGRTYDPYFNAAARQLRAEGWFHNQARMIWGKRILEWSESPRLALETMAAIMNRWSLDGRDPNSVTGYGWTLGRYDRPQGPERKVYGTVRPMPTHDGRLRQARDYIERWAPGELEAFKAARKRARAT